MLIPFFQECNCNDHASSCYFNPSVFEATGQLSGGVCENCEHNTEGRQCDSCKLGFFQDPELQLNHPDICKRTYLQPLNFYDYIVIYFFLNFRLLSAFEKYWFS